MAQQFLDSDGLARVLSAVNQKISDSAGASDQQKNWIGSQSTFDAITNIDNDTLYFIYND